MTNNERKTEGQQNMRQAVKEAKQLVEQIDVLLRTAQHDNRMEYLMSERQALERILLSNFDTYMAIEKELMWGHI